MDAEHMASKGNHETGSPASPSPASSSPASSPSPDTAALPHECGLQLPTLLLDQEARIVALSAAATKWLGWSLQECLRRDAHDLLCADTYQHQHERQQCPLLQQPAASALLMDATAQIPPRESATWQTAYDHHLAVEYALTACESSPDYRLLHFTPIDDSEPDRVELQKMALLCEMNPTPMLELDDSGQLLYANSAMNMLIAEYGFDENGCISLLPTQLEEHIQQCLQQSEPLQVEKSFHDTTWMWQLNAFHGGSHMSILMTGTDITALRRHERDSQQLERLLQAERDRARHEYIAKMVHDFRSPLNALVGFAGLLQESLQDRLQGQEEKMLQHIVDGGRQLAQQISASLEAARVEAAQLQLHASTLALAPLIQTCVDQLQSLADSKQLMIQSSCDVGSVCADGSLLHNALTNLISNAIKYTDSGCIEIRAAPVSGSHYCIEVIDTGCGIDSSEQDAIFSLYGRTASHNGSTIEGQGIGLCSVREIAQLHGGTITVHSAPGEGSTFSLLLPYLPPEG